MPKIRGFKYSKQTGNVYRNFRTSGCTPGAITSTAKNGYKRLTHKGIEYLQHRFIHSILGIDIPPGMHIDHINGKRNDNKLTNLRIVTQSENLSNQKKHRDGKSVGVFTRWGKWRAVVRGAHIGVFQTKAEAIAARAKFIERHVYF